MTAKVKYTHYRMVNLVPGELDFILCVHLPDDGEVVMTVDHDNVTCPNCNEENIRTAVKFYDSLCGVGV